MRIFDTTKLESAVTWLRHWIDQRRGEPSHWYALCAFFGALAVAGGLLAAVKAFGAPMAVIGFAGVASVAGAIAGQKSED